MKKIIRYITNGVRRIYPLSYLFALFQKSRAHFRFKNERMLIKGKDISENHHKSIIYFSAHRCASSYISRILNALSENSGMTHIDFDRYINSTNQSKYKLFSDARFLENSFKKQGYYYGAFRSFRNIPDMEDYAVLLELRDPRDVLTSHYYSIAYGDTTNLTILAKRKKVQTMTVDEYVLHNRHQFKETYETYCNELLEMPNTLFVKYEDMVMDFEPWLKRVAAHIDLDSDELLLNKIINEANFTVSSEDAHSHKRQVTPGDHKQKLMPETIEIVNKEFHDILEKLEYL